jgi:hypothetical protein
MPDIIPIGRTSTVTVKAIICNPKEGSSNVDLLLLSGTGNGPTVLGQLTRVEDNSYFIQVPLYVPSPGEIRLQVSATFRVSSVPILSPILLVGAGSTLTDATASVSLLVPPALHNVTDNSMPPDSFELDSSPNGVAIGGAVQEGSAVATSGFAVTIDAEPYSVSSIFDINQYLAAEYPNSVADATITPIYANRAPGYQVFFVGEETGNWPVVIVYHDGYVVRVLYSSTDDASGSVDQNGLKAFNQVVEHLSFTK